MYLIIILYPINMYIHYVSIKNKKYITNANLEVTCFEKNP